MNHKKKIIGDIFISYSSKDKIFVRKLVKSLKSNGYSVWSYEHELLVGDSIVTKISKAISTSKVIIIISSQAANNSNWLKYELNKATEMMIQGKTRLIPIVIDEAPMLPEIRSLLYADFRESYRFGIKGILTALQYEVNKNLINSSFWKQSEILTEKVFGPIGFGFIDSEYLDIDYEVLFINIPSLKNREIEIIYESIDNYAISPKPLSDSWFYEYQESKEHISTSYYLILSNRTVGFTINESDKDEPRIMLKNGYSNKHYFFIDFSQLNDLDKRKDILTKAKVFLEQKIISFSNANI